MKAILFLALIISLSSFAQVKTGGGIIEVDGYVPPENKSDEYIAIHEFLYYTKLYANLCAQQTKLKTDLDIQSSDNNFEAIYNKLKSLSTLNQGLETCHSVNPFFQCLGTIRDGRLKEKASAVNPEWKEWENEFNLKNKKKTKEIIEFFKNIDKACEAQSCEM